MLFVFCCPLCFMTLHQVSKTPAPPRREENQALRPRQEANENGYATYDSPFESYPLLRLHSRPVMFSGDTTTTFDPSSFLSSSSGSLRLPTSSPLPFPLPNLKPLKLATASKMLDPSKRICQYEVPGGGVCRDEGCEDVHLGRMGGGGERGLGGVEPTGTWRGLVSGISGLAHTIGMRVFIHFASITLGFSHR